MSSPIEVTYKQAAVAKLRKYVRGDIPSDERKREEVRKDTLEYVRMMGESTDITNIMNGWAETTNTLKELSADEVARPFSPFVIGAQRAKQGDEASRTGPSIVVFNATDRSSYTTGLQRAGVSGEGTDAVWDLDEDSIVRERDSAMDPPDYVLVRIDGIRNPQGIDFSKAVEMKYKNQRVARLEVAGLVVGYDVTRGSKDSSYKTVLMTNRGVFEIVSSERSWGGSFKFGKYSIDPVRTYMILYVSGNHSADHAQYISTLDPLRLNGMAVLDPESALHAAFQLVLNTTSSAALVPRKPLSWELNYKPVGPKPPIEPSDSGTGISGTLIVVIIIAAVVLLVLGVLFFMIFSTPRKVGLTQARANSFASPR
jgi:hypothetical protein